MASVRFRLCAAAGSSHAIIFTFAALIHFDEQSGGAVFSSDLQRNVLRDLIQMHAISWELVLKSALQDCYASILANDASTGMVDIINGDPYHG